MDIINGGLVVSAGGGLVIGGEEVEERRIVRRRGCRVRRRGRRYRGKGLVSSLLRDSDIADVVNMLADSSYVPRYVCSDVQDGAKNNCCRAAGASEDRTLRS